MTHARLLLVLVVMAAPSGCIDDPAAVDDQFALTQEDALLLGLNFWRQALEAQLDVDIDGQPATSMNAPMRAPETFTNTDTATVACTLDGDVQQILVASITVDDELDELVISAEMTLTHDGCREEIDGRTFSFYGAPSVVVRVDQTYGPGDARTLAGSIEGAAIVITQGAPVLCTIDLSAGPGVVQDGLVTYALRGSFCGEVFDETVTEAVN